MTTATENRTPNRRRAFIVAAAGGATVAASVLAIGPTGLLNSSSTTPDEPAPATGSPRAAATGTTSRGDLTTSKEYSGKASFGSTWTMALGVKGTITAAPANGALVNFGDELIRVNNVPVYLVEGTMPMYRTLERVANKKKWLTGDDVSQLQTFLIANGFDAKGKMVVDGKFGIATERAVKDWQKAVGFEQNGKVDTKQIVFAPEPVRNAQELRVGAAFSDYKVTGSTASVTTTVSSKERSKLPVGAKVELLVGDQTMHGEVTAHERGEASEGQSSWKAVVTPATTLPGDTDAVTIKTSTKLATDAILAPTSSLVALAEGGFAVELVDEAGNATLTRVEIGKSLDGQVEITSGLTEGQTVVVAK